MPTVKNGFRRVGVGAQYICFADGEQQSGYESAVTKMENVASIQTTEGRISETVYGSNKVFEEETAQNPPSMVVANRAFPADILHRMNGHTVSGAWVTHNNRDEGEYFAYGIVFPKRNGKDTYIWYPKCKLTAASADRDGNTKDANGINAAEPSLTIRAFEFNDAGDYEVEYDCELVTEGNTPITEAAFFAAPLTAPISNG